jgi:hypothetical protein
MILAGGVNGTDLINRTEGGSAGASFLPGAHTVLRRARHQS